MPNADQGGSTIVPKGVEPLTPTKAPSSPVKVRKTPVCACGGALPECSKCGEGYLQRTLEGLVPHFKEVEVKLRKVPCCKCQKQHANCSGCKEGYLERTMAGEVPHFMFLEEGDSSSEKPKAEVKTSPGEGLGF